MAQSKKRPTLRRNASKTASSSPAFQPQSDEERLALLFDKRDQTEPRSPESLHISDKILRTLLNGK